MVYYSHKLRHPERNYVAYKRECLAVYKSVKHFCVYLLVQEFIISNDNEKVKWLTEKEPDKLILDRWLVEFKCYRFVVENVNVTIN